MEGGSNHSSSAPLPPQYRMPRVLQQHSPLPSQSTSATRPAPYVPAPPPGGWDNNGPVRARPEGISGDVAEYTAFRVNDVPFITDSARDLVRQGRLQPIDAPAGWKYMVPGPCIQEPSMGGGRDDADGRSGGDAGGDGETVAESGIREARRRNTGPIRRRDYIITFWGDFGPAANFDKERAKLRYAIWQKEKCPTTGRPHWQIYIECHDPVTIDWVKNTLLQDNRTHVEVRRMLRTVARDYCMKNKTRWPGDKSAVGPFEWGSFASQGKRTDLDAVKEKMDDGVPMSVITAEHFSTVARHAGGLKYCKQIASQTAGKSERGELHVSLYYGPTGTGKTRAAMDEAMLMVDNDMDKIFTLDADSGKSGTVWFDGYESGPVLLIDDYDSWIKLAYLLKLLDRYPVRLQTKGAMQWACWTRVFITSNKTVNEWTDVDGKPLDDRHRKALLRRIHRIEFFPALGRRIQMKPAPTSAPTLVGGMTEDNDNDTA